MTQTRKNNLVTYYDSLQEALDKSLITLPNIEDRYPPVFVIRTARYDPNNHSVKPELSDFFSQIQLSEKTENIVTLKDPWENYSCSCFVCSKKIEEIKLPIDFSDVDELARELRLDGLVNLINAMRLPRKNKKKAILIGKVNPVCGTIIREDTHIHWFIYKNARPQDYFSEWGVIYEKVGKSEKCGRIEHRTGTD